MEIGGTNDHGASLDDPCGDKPICLKSDVESWGRTLESLRTYALKLATGAFKRDDPALGDDLAGWYWRTKGLALTNVSLFGAIDLWGLLGQDYPGSILQTDGDVVALQIGAIRDAQPLLNRGMDLTGILPPARLAAQDANRPAITAIGLAKIGVAAWLGFKAYEAFKGD